MLHCPEEAIKLVTNDNYKFFLFEHAPNVDRFLEEHKMYEAMLKNLGIEVNLLADHVVKNCNLLDRLPNLAYLHDIGVISSYGSIISKMSSRGRCHEEVVVREALESLEIPTLYEPKEGEAFEGCLLLSPSTVFIADTERHSRESINIFIDYILNYFDEVIYSIIPQQRRFMHPDMVMNRVTRNLLIYYPPALKKTFYITRKTKRQINIKKFMKKRKIDMFPVSNKEQKNWATSIVPIEPGVIINYDISLKPKTVQLLEKEGIRFIHFHPDALLAGGGSLRCFTMRIWRD